MLHDFFHLIGVIFPFECMKTGFMQQAMACVLLLSPLTAVAGLQVINFRLAFFSDAIGHSAFTGIALGLIFGISPSFTMAVYAVSAGLLIMLLENRSGLSPDTAAGVVFSGSVACGLALVSRERGIARDVQRFLYGDILTVSENEILAMAVLLAALLVFEFISFNQLLAAALNRTLAEVHRIRVSLHLYWYSFFLSLVVIFAVRTAGILMVTALLVVPAASARNIARSSLEMFWTAVFFSLVSGITGLLISALPEIATAAGATIVIVGCVLFFISLVFKKC